MKRLPIILILLFLFPWPAFSEGGERIISYDAFIDVKPAGDMVITERIKVVCEGGKIKRGIYRDFPTRYKDDYGNDVSVAFEVLDIRKDDSTEPWHTEDRDNGVRVYIGSKDVILAPGEYTYAITYRTGRQLGFFEDHDELYWNVTGNGWDFVIEKASAVVSLPEGAEILSTSAYTGGPGDKGADFVVTRDDAGRAVFTATRTLNPQEGLTIVVMWPKGFVREPSRVEKARYLLSDNSIALAGSAGIVVLLIYYFLVWLKVGRDPEKGVIIPLFEAPKGFSPAAVRYVMRMGFDDKAFAAAIVNMAVKGFITIEEDKNGEYTLIKKNGDESALSPAEKGIAGRFFGTRDSIAIKTANHATIKQAIEDLRKSLAIEYEKIHFFTNSSTLIPGLLISLLVIAATVMLGRSSSLAGFMSLWLAGWTAGCAVLLYQSIKAWKTALTARAKKLSGLGGALYISLFTLPFLGFECFGLWTFSKATSPFAVVCIFVIIMLNILFYHLMKAPTIKGRKVMDQIEGFKLYLSVAEKDRLNELNPPEKTPEVFEKFLPYALALDVEQEWCGQFAEVLKRAGMESTYRPAWYAGHHPGALGMAGLASGLGAMSAGISSSSSPPGSKSGGSGGGSSGGGGGGGGGGGW